MVIVHHTDHRYYWNETRCHSCNRIHCVFLPILTDLPENMLHTLCSLKYASFHMSVAFYGYYFTSLCHCLHIWAYGDAPSMSRFVDLLFLFFFCWCCCKYYVSPMFNVLMTVKTRWSDRWVWCKEECTVLPAAGVRSCQRVLCTG